MLKKLNLKFSFRLNGVIWNMLIDEDASFLILEVRDVTMHKAHFAIVDLLNDELVMDELVFDELWWIGVGAANSGNIIFYVYENDQNPVPSSYFLYSVKTRTILWEASDFTFSSITERGILGYSGHKDESQPVLKNLITGKEEQIDAETFKNLNKTSQLVKNGNNSSILPFHYPEETDYFLVVKKYLVQAHNIDAVKAIDYLELGSLIIISYYLYNENSQHDNKHFDNYILVLSKGGEELLKEKIDEDLSGIGLGIFFVVKKQLIFVKNKSIIKSYRLTNYE